MAAFAPVLLLGRPGILRDTLERCRVPTQAPNDALARKDGCWGVIQCVYVVAPHIPGPMTSFVVRSPVVGRGWLRPRFFQSHALSPPAFSRPGSNFLLFFFVFGSQTFGTSLSTNLRRLLLLVPPWSPRLRQRPRKVSSRCRKERRERAVWRRGGQRGDEEDRRQDAREKGHKRRCTREGETRHESNRRAPFLSELRLHAPQPSFGRLRVASLTLTHTHSLSLSFFLPLSVLCGVVQCYACTQWLRTNGARFDKVTVSLPCQRPA